MRVGVVTRGKYGHRLIDTILEHTSFEVVSTDVPESLPGFIEDPEAFLDELGFDETVFRSDMMILYIFHPDLTPEIVRMAGRAGVKAVLIPGGIGRAGSISELQTISKEYDLYIEIDEICCTLEECGIEAVDTFAKVLGRPQYQVSVDQGRITDVQVIRGSPCGSTWAVAPQMKGKRIFEAPAASGLYCQQYPCRAVRGTPGGIHTSADLHKDAMEKALGLPTDLVIPEQSRPIRIRSGVIETT